MMKKTICMTLMVALFHWAQGQDLSEMYENLLPSVVKILSSEQTDLGNGMVATEGGIGSGVLIGEDGLILTASHVVNTADQIRVEFASGEVVPADVISSVPAADISTIKIRWMPKEYAVAKVGDSDQIKIGNQIIMIGAPYGLDFSLSVGYISGRRIKQYFANGAKRIEFLQTEASINQGNSGGPMFNMNGEVVAIASYILTESGGSQGLGFAATTKVCKELLLEKPTPWTGLEGKILPQEIAEILNVPQGSGLLVQKVVSLSPADFLGLRGGQYDLTIEGTELSLGGDIILEVNGITIRDEDSLSDINRSMQQNDTVQLKVLRGGKVVDLSGTIPK